MTDVSATPTSEPGRERLWSWAALLLFAFVELLVWQRVQPPPVRPVEAPPGEFSAARAGQVLERLLADGQPHPSGSAAQARVRARLLRELQELGLAPELQTSMACGEGVCAELTNVLAELPGSEPPSQLLLAAHYDSVPSGPGAGDDGQSVATLLELARALRAQPIRQGIWLLFTDGEELGLLGARMFVQQHPLLKQLRVAVNLEARGNRGPSLMFQTAADSGALVRAFGQASRPVATSLFGPVYRTLPNDTDFTVFARQGLRGLNFAFVGGVEHYHTPHDNIEHLDLRSVQQQGDGVLATLRGSGSLADGGQELAFFDVLGLWLVTLPAAWLLPAALLGLTCWVFVLVRERRTRSARATGRAALCVLLAWGLPVLATALVGLVLELLGAIPFAVIATPQPFLLAMLFWVAGAQAGAYWLLPEPSQRRAYFDLTWLGWLLLGLVLAATLAPASYLLVLPGLAAALVRVLSSLRGRSIPSWELAAALLAGLLWLPLLTLLPSVLELSMPAALAAAFAIGLSPLGALLGPLLASERARLVLSVGGLLLALSQLVLPRYSERVPQRLSLAIEAEASGEAHWLADGFSGELPSALRQAAQFADRPSRPHPWPGLSRGLMYVAPAPATVLPLPAPRLVRKGASLRLELEAPPDLWGLGIRHVGPERILAARWQGRQLDLRSEATGQRVMLVLGPQRSLSIELDYDREPGAPPQVLALALGLPEAGLPLQVARGTKAVASGFGDLTVLHLAPRTEP
jgi:hypothetical protein